MNTNELSLAIASVVGILISLLATYVPGFAEWFYQEALKDWRGLIMSGIGVLVAVGIWLVSCVLAWIPGLVSCDNALRDLVMAFVAFMVANQTTYQVSPVSPTRKKLGLDN